MGIVFITIPGSPKRAFVNELHRRTNGGVELVIVQKAAPFSFSKIAKRVVLLFSRGRLFRNIFYAVRLRLSPMAKKALGYFREHRIEYPEDAFLPKVMEVDSVNSDFVYKELKKISPKLLVVWGCAVLKPHILTTAERVINLHMGLCPHYRGALANHHAVLKSEFSKIGATIHYATEKADAGDVLSLLQADTNLHPKEMFHDLNKRAFEKYLDVATTLFFGREIQSFPQDLSVGENLFLREWTPEVRWRVANVILEREKMAQSKGGKGL